MSALVEKNSNGTVAEHELFIITDSICIFTHISAQILCTGCKPKSTIWTSVGYIHRRLDHIAEQLCAEATRKYQMMCSAMPSKIANGEAAAIECFVLRPVGNQLNQLHHDNTDPRVRLKELTTPKASSRVPFWGQTRGIDQNSIVFR